MLITEEYARLNARLHQERETYGRTSGMWVEMVYSTCVELGTTDVLDYGCGKGEMHLGLPFAIQNYDPAVPKYSASPQPAEIVVCTDVLEHVEPECMTDVLADLRRCVKNVGYFGIPTFEALKTLPDGRNAHISVHDDSWWAETVSEAGFTLDEVELLEMKRGIYLMMKVS